MNILHKILIGTIRNRQLVLSLILVSLIFLEIITGTRYYIVLNLYCTSKSTITIPVLLSKILVDCNSNSISIYTNPQILPYIMIVLTLVTCFLSVKFLENKSIFGTFSKCLVYASAILLIPLPLYYNIGTVSFTIIISNPILASCIYVMQIPTILLSKVFPENEKLTEVYVSIDELIEETLSISHEESESE